MVYELKKKNEVAVRTSEEHTKTCLGGLKSIPRYFCKHSTFAIASSSPQSRTLRVCLLFAKPTSRLLLLRRFVTAASGLTTTFISGDLAEKYLSLTVEDIVDTTCVKHQLLRITHVQQILSNKLFSIQLRKSSSISSTITHTILTILSYIEKEHIFPLSILAREMLKGGVAQHNQGGYSAISY
ncbi:hypothetical protein AABB24_025495 [Solanum stoloniferum]|uniref:Uncharacterized protein n=1 Tax=Solanum stoloniferum TaxID=62892 RepID=A0ABD2SAL4_9SOLN